MCLPALSEGRLLGHANLEMAEVAARVGYADVTSFSRAFSRWFNMPPGAYRRTILA